MDVRWLLGAALLLTVLSEVRLESQRVVCYYTNWSVYRQGLGKFTPQNINPYLCTHLVYAFGGITNDFMLRPFDKYQDIDKGGYAKFNGLKSFNKNLKTLLAIGGWNEGSKRFSLFVADPEARANFTRAAVRYLRQHNFDGLDLDWEYPASREGSSPEDKRNYVLFVQELRQVFEKEAASGKQRLLLTMAVPAGLDYADRGYDVPALNKALDFFNLLTYDYHVATEAVVNHHAPLRNPDGDSEFDINAELTVEATINYYLKKGADPSKLVLGIPTYGRGFKLFNPADVRLGAPADGPAEAGKLTKEAGYLAYYEICEKIGVESWEVEKPHSNDVGPFAYKDNQWVGYDDEEMVARKAEYVSQKRLGGIMFWAIDNDDFRGLCTGKAYPLIEAGKAALLKNSATSDVGPSRSSNKITTRRPAAGAANSKLRPAGSRTTTTSRPAATKSTTTVSSVDSTPEWQTPEPPVTPDNGVEFTCKDEGFFPHPRDCKKYFWCLDSGALGIVSHAFTCPSGLHFNKFTDSCDYATNVLCRIPSASSAASTTLKPFLSQSTTVKTTTRPPTTRTTTTTEAPFEEEDYSDEGKDYLLEEDNPPEDPNNLQQLLQLIEDLGGVDAVKRMLKEGTRGSRDGALTPQQRKALAQVIGQPSSSPRQPVRKTASQFRNQPVGNPEQAPKAAVNDKPLNYVTIARNRPSTPKPVEEQEEEPEEEEVGSEEADFVEETSTRAASTSPKYITLNRNRGTPPPTADPEIVEVRPQARPEAPLPTPTPNRSRPNVLTRTSSPARTTEAEAPTTTKPRANILDRLRATTTVRSTTTTKVEEILETEEPAFVDARPSEQPLEEKPTSSSDAILEVPSSPETIVTIITSPIPITNDDSAVEESEEIEEEIVELEEEEEEPVAPIVSTTTPTSTTTTTTTTLAPPSAPSTRNPKLLPANRFNNPSSSQASAAGVPRARAFTPSTAPTTTTTTLPPPPRTRPPVSRKTRPPPVVNTRPVNAPNDEFFKIDNLDVQDGLLGGSQVVNGAIAVGSNANGDKVEIDEDGSIVCYDAGTFPYPEDCKQFINCARSENGAIRGWLYTCPKNLSFDPVGGICNWGSPLRCKA